MDERQRIERQIWRMGLALTGSPAGASWVLAAAWRTNTDVMRLGESRVVRLVGVKSREWMGRNAGYGGGRTPSDASGMTDEARRMRGALRELDPSAREVWILREVVGLETIEIARGLGCTREVAERDTEAGEGGLMASLGADMHSAAGAWAGYIGSISAGDAIQSAEMMHRSISARRRIVTLVQIVIVVGIMGVLVWFGLGMLEAQAERERGNTGGIHGEPGSTLTDEEDGA